MKEENIEVEATREREWEKRASASEVEKRREAHEKERERCTSGVREDEGEPGEGRGGEPEGSKEVQRREDGDREG